MRSDDESGFDATISDLTGQEQPRLFASRSRRSRWRWGLLVLLVLVLLGGGELLWAARPLFLAQRRQTTPTVTATAAPTSTTPPTFTGLSARPLHFPVVTSVATCPVSRGRQISPNFGLAAGTGPLSIVGVDAAGNVPYGPPSAWGDTLGWGGIPKVLWIFPSTFAGPVLVRGQRLDQPGELRFISLGGPLLSELPISVATGSASSAYQEAGSWYIRFNAPGCYGLQVDWLNGTEWIIFRAT
jgi:hypothetical protein